MTLETALKLVYRELGTEGQLTTICPFPTNWDTSQGDAADWCPHGFRYPHIEHRPTPPLTDGLLAVILRRLGKDAETSAQADKALWDIFRAVRGKPIDLVRTTVMVFAQYLEARK